MTPATIRTTVLNPLERFSEIVFGLIMVLSFTGALSVAEVGREDIRLMLLGAIGCNLAWGIIDAAFYLISCLAERRRNVTILRSVQEADPTHAQRIIADVTRDSYNSPSCCLIAKCYRSKSLSNCQAWSFHPALFLQLCASSSAKSDFR